MGIQCSQELLIVSKKVVHIVLNPFIQDSRVIRECTSLAKYGYEVTVIAYWINGMALEEVQNGFNIRRLPLMTKSWANISMIQVLKYFEFLRNFRPKFEFFKNVLWNL